MNQKHKNCPMNIKTIATLTAFATGISASNAAVLVTEDFAYPDGNLVGNSPSSGGTWANHSGSGNFIQVTGEKAFLEHGSGSREDANISFSSTTSGTIYYAFDFSVTADVNLFDEYFAHFKDSGTDFTSRLHIDPATEGGDYTVGISGFSGAPDATVSPALGFGTTYRATVRFDFGTGISTLWINAETEGDPGIDSAADTVPEINSFAFRQASSSESITVDNLVISTTFAETNPIPEPATGFLGSLALLGLVRRRR